MALSESKGGVPPKQHKLHRNNVEQEENEKMQEKRDRERIEGKQRFPQMLHKPEGLEKLVHNDEELAAALDKGWYENLNDARAQNEEPEELPTMVSQMTLSQARDFIEAHQTDAAFLMAQEADERNHGSRAAVLALLEAAKDAVPTKKQIDTPLAKAHPKPAPKKK